jgi:hypothetical protein
MIYLSLILLSYKPISVLTSLLSFGFWKVVDSTCMTLPLESWAILCRLITAFVLMSGE